MYMEFLAAYPADGEGDPGSWDQSSLIKMAGFRELMVVGAGKSFGNGIVRIHNADQARRAAEYIGEAFPEYRGRVIPLARDWLGRQFAVPTRGGDPIDGLVLLIEPASGEAFEIDAGLIDLFDREMVNDPDTFLAADLFSEWRLEHPDVIPVEKCVGFKVPLFLGGRGVVENLELSDEAVYWSLFGQLRSQAMGRRR